MSPTYASQIPKEEFIALLRKHVSFLKKDLYHYIDCGEIYGYVACQFHDLPVMESFRKDKNLAVAKEGPMNYADLKLPFELADFSKAMNQLIDEQKDEKSLTPNELGHIDQLVHKFETSIPIYTRALAMPTSGYIKAVDTYEKKVADVARSENLDETGMNTLRAEPYLLIMSYLHAYHISVSNDAIDQYLLPYTNAVTSILMNTIQYSEEAQVHRDDLKWHSPFDHCVFLMGNMALIYRTIGRQEALLHVCGTCDNHASVTEVAVFRLGLDFKGNLIKLIVADNTKGVPFALHKDIVANRLKERTHVEADRVWRVDQIRDLCNMAYNLGLGVDIIQDCVKQSNTMDRFSSDVIQDLYELGVPEDDERKGNPSKTWDQYKRCFDSVMSILFPTLTISVLMATSKSVRLREKRLSLVRKGGARTSNDRTCTMVSEDVVYHTVRISMEDQIIDKAGNYITDTVRDSGAVIEGRRHVRRGHFAVYTKERPLFGKYVGMVWIPEMVVNRHNKLRVSSSYEVTTDKK